MPLHIPCSHCHSTNRTPAARLGDDPKCGKCGEPLLRGQPLVLSAANFSVMMKSELPLVVDFWAPWCGPCKMMAPVFENSAAEFSGRAILAKLNTEDEPAIGGQFGIRSIPTLIIFKGGREIARQSGAMDLGNLNRFIENAL